MVKKSSLKRLFEIQHLLVIYIYIYIYIYQRSLSVFFFLKKKKNSFKFIHFLSTEFIHQLG